MLDALCHAWIIFVVAERRVFFDKIMLEHCTLEGLVYNGLAKPFFYKPRYLRDYIYKYVTYQTGRKMKEVCKKVS
jgi:hypothetical protein